MAFKLQSLYIKEYKNIKEQTFDFSSNTGYIALIGLNGSGKSNLLEAISLIFDTIYGIPCSETVGGFKITYTIDGTSYTSTNLDENNEPIDLIKPEQLPSSIIACYSGEDLRLWHRAYEEYYNSYFKTAITNSRYIPKSLYINKYCWKIALLALLSSENRDIQNFLNDTLHINKDDVQVQLHYNTIINEKEHDASRWLKEIKGKYEDNLIPLSQFLGIDLNPTFDVQLTEDQRLFYYLYILSMPKIGPKQKVDKLISDIDIMLGNVNFIDLSEGEKKLILIECITKVLGDENALILLDEPDAHTHIARKKELLNAIESFEGQIIMTTHSPVFVEIIQKLSPSNVFYIENGQINSDKNNLIKNLSANELNMLDGSLYTKSGMYLLVEGKSDVKCIKEAIKRLKYKKLEDVAIISFNGTPNALEFYNQAIKDSMSCINKLIFLFDYDEAGFNAWNDVGDVVSQYRGKCERLFYQDNYISSFTTKPRNKSAEILLEDLFNENSYQLVTNVVHLHKCKDFRNINWKQQLGTSKQGIKSTVDAIKFYIEDKCDTFLDDSWFDGFKPVLDKLLEVFNL